MNPLDLIKDRRSVRNYEPAPVTEEQLRELLTCALYAPSALGRLPCQFVVVDSRADLDWMAGQDNSYRSMRTAPLAILVAADVERASLWVEDCAAAAQNILLAATALGLGSCWCAIRNSEELSAAFAEKFNFPANVRPFCAVAVGTAAEHRERPARSLDGRVHRGSF